MNLTEFRTLIRKDLHDEDAADYRWTDEELDRHIAHALKDFSLALPLEQKMTLPTTAGSREISLAGLSDRVMLEAVEYPAGQFPARYRRFSLWNEVLTLLGVEVPDGSECVIYYGQLHTLDASGSSVPAVYEELVAAGACGYAAAAETARSINRVNVGGAGAPDDWLQWSREKLAFFRAGLKTLGRKNRVRVRRLYTPYCSI